MIVVQKQAHRLMKLTFDKEARNKHWGKNQQINGASQTDDCVRENVN